MGAAAGLTSLLVGLAAPGAQAATPPPAQDTDAFCVNVPEGNAFNDLSGNEANINCLAFTEITTGKTATTYAPGDPVTRGQMATFIARMIDTANDLAVDDLPDLPAGTADAFTDDNGIAPHEANINRLAEAGVVAGVGGGLFAPNQPVSRAQMATFINNAQAFLSGTNTRLTSTDDFFTDDDNQTAHQANINGLAAFGIVQGGPGGIAQTLYGPDLPVNRSQMASFIIRYLGLAESLDIIEAPDATDPGSNATIDITPTDAGSAINADGSGAPNASSDDRTYTATGLEAGQAYRITLVHSANIDSSAGQFAFVEDGNTGFALATPNASASIISVTAGGAVTPAVAPGTVTGSVHVAAADADGEITFVVDAVTVGSVTPVIYEAPASAADPNTRLNLGDDGKPTEDFGVGGAFLTLPEESADGAFTGDVIGVDKANNIVVVDDAVQGDVYLIYGDHDDDVFTAPNGPSIATFEAKLSRGDTLAGTYVAGTSAPSTFTLTDVTPVTPVIGTVAPSDTTATVEVTGTHPGATVFLYVVPDANDDGVEPAPADGSAPTVTVASPNGGSVDVPVTGLTASSHYVVFAQQVLDDQRSAFSASEELDTTATPVAVTITAATGANDQHSVDVTFSTDVACGPVGTSQAVNVNNPADTVAVVTCAQGGLPNQNQKKFTFGVPLTNNETYRLDLSAGAVTVSAVPAAAVSSPSFIA